ncbi:hypothetical protein DNH61_25345 [Paenibacillus sambharensis]|uniref:Copper amine oxidase-like N-terminal domain-containing protein n=1 Tax=Paenibacillus sambharensis TaxID=1803190 RepID=A0A2W1LDG8_9BACL|nr:stalk domain-containing protein [Paenibacillus sambharensis]PZD93105.1 hypothetical protein DNH61_25345 [Paenibacillus sambharensis]
MKKIRMKKSAFAATLVATSLVFGAVGAFGATGLQKITAYLNHDIKFNLNSSVWTPRSADGSKITPITYEGTTYLPARAIADAVGTDIGWNGSTKTISIGEGAADAEAGSSTGAVTGTPTTPSTGTTTGTTTGSTAASKNKGSLSDPIALGTSYTYTDKSDYKPEKNGSYGATYTITVHKAAPITSAGFEALGLKQPDNTDEVNYMLVDLTIKIADAWFKAGTDAKDMYLNIYRPNIWGTRSTDGTESVIGSNDLGFEGSLYTKEREQTVGIKVAPGEKKSYEVTGQAIVGVPKDKPGLLAFRKQAQGIEYNDSFIYFKLK